MISQPKVLSPFFWSNTLFELYLLKQVSWLVEFSILFSMFCLHFVLGDNNRAEQNAAAAIFGFLFPSLNLIIFPLVQGCQTFSRTPGGKI